MFCETPCYGTDGPFTSIYDDLPSYTTVMFRSYVKFPEGLQFQWSTIVLRTKDPVRVYHWQMKGKFSWENTCFF